MKTRFTVVSENSEYSLGEYMLAKAGKKKESTTLPIATATLRQPSAVVSFLNYINDKLMVKEAPQKDKVMRAFPFRTAAAALLSALLVCTFAITYGVASVNASVSDDNATYMSISEDAELESARYDYRFN